jgi:putative ABC transport system ATP-binding protein
MTYLPLSFERSVRYHSFRIRHPLLEPVIVTLQPAVDRADPPGAASNRQPLVALREVVKVYPTPDGGFPALRGLNAEIYAGEFVGIIGKSGAGKSTLLNMITGVDHLSSGEVLIQANGHAISVHMLSESELARFRGRTIGVVHQSFQLLPMLTLLENVMLPMDLAGRYSRRQSRAQALELLRLVDIAEHANKLPSLISGGQQQRVAIARALANDPPLLVADEPTGSLDSVTAETVFGVFEHLVAEGRTIIMVTHDQGLAPRFSRHLYLADGEFISPQPSTPDGSASRRKRSPRP